MKEIAIFHHVYQFGDWEKVYTEQVVALQESGLYDVATYRFIGVNGDKPMPFRLNKTNKLLVNDSKEKWNLSCEYLTQKALYDYCNLKETNVLYIQTKGVSWSLPEEQNNTMSLAPGIYTIRQIYENSQKWRKYIEFFLIKNWKKCNELLDVYDTVGTEWKNHSIISDVRYNMAHYAGNMWWSNSNYIKKLDLNFITNNLIVGRYASELWIGTKNPKMYNFYDSNRNLYLDSIELKEYEALV